MVFDDFFIVQKHASLGYANKNSLIRDHFLAKQNILNISVILNSN